MNNKQTVKFTFHTLLSGASVKRKEDTNMYNDDYVFTAVNFARMYGVAETLNPMQVMNNEDFFAMIDAWTKEYLLLDRCDSVAFFEEKIKLL